VISHDLRHKHQLSHNAAKKTMLACRLLFLLLTSTCVLGFVQTNNLGAGRAFDRFRTIKPLSSLRSSRINAGKFRFSHVARMSGGGEDEQPTIGFLGMGIMGVPMALNLLKAGFKVTVWNRSEDKCKECIKAGAASCKTPAEVFCVYCATDKCHDL
jgi:hypothetical protein